MVNSRSAQIRAFGRLLDVMDNLRENCPWDRKQTIQSLRHLTIEEIYELSQAINENDWEEIKKELGDIVLHLVFYAKIASEKQKFDIADVLNGICDKLIYRHPHIYGQEKVKDEEQVKQNWERLKIREQNKTRSVLGGVPDALPSVIKAIRIQEKVRGVGFDFENKEQAYEKVQEEWQEFRCAKNKQEQSSELGDVLFSIINYARFIGINSDLALEKTNKKFILRFKKMEGIAKKENRSIETLSLSELDRLWDRVKENENRHLT